jgi:hypothetical protein
MNTGVFGFPPLENNSDFPFIPLRGVSATRTTAGSSLYPSGVDTAVPWQATFYDTDGFWFASDPSRLTIPSAIDGRYVIVSTALRLNANFNVARDYFYIGLYRSDGTQQRGFLGNMGGFQTNVTIPLNTSPIRVFVGQYFQTRVFQDTGSAMQHDTTPASNNYLSLQVVG